MKRLRDHDEAIAILRQEQIRRGPSQQALATRMHCARTTVGDQLAGRSGAGARQFFDLANALGYDLALVPREEPSARCSKCGGALTACVDCATPALCGEAHCATHLPEGGFSSALVPREDTP